LKDVSPRYRQNKSHDQGGGEAFDHHAGVEAQVTEKMKMASAVSGAGGAGGFSETEAEEER
jgi:hypothetical protein